MKIVHIIGSLEIGGAEKLLKDLLPVLKEKGNDVSLIVIGKSSNFFVNHLKDNGIQVVLLDKSNIYNPLIIFDLYKKINSFKYIHVHLFPALYFVSLIKVFSPRKILFYTEHNTSNARRENRCLKYLEIIIYGRYSKIISISKETQFNLTNWLGLTNKLDRFCTVENGINIEEYSSTAQGNEGSEIQKKVILMVSRFTIQKDHETLIKAFNIVASKRNDVLLYFAGEGKTISKIKNVVNELSLENLVHFLGNRNDIPELMGLSYIGVQSSYWEGFGLTAVEFMASGKPIIASDVKGLSEVVKGGGLLFELGNYKELSKIILKLLDNEGFYDKVSKDCFQKAQLYSIENMAKRYIDTYNEFI